MTYSFGADKFKHNIKNITKRQILSSTSSIYDPLGLATPISVKAKIILRKIWAVSPKLDWDDLVPESISNGWNNFVEYLIAVKSITFKGSLISQYLLISRSVLKNTKPEFSRKQGLCIFQYRAGNQLVLGY